MAFNGLGGNGWTLEPYEEMDIVYWFGGDARYEGGEDHGAQYCMAHPINVYDTTLLVTAQGKADTGFVDGHWQYRVRIHNMGPNTARFNLQGGGLA